MGIFNFFKRGKGKMTGYKDISEALSAYGINCAMSEEMEQAISLWRDIYQNKPSWKKSGDVYSLNLGKSISQELQTLTMSEFSASIDNDDYLNSVLQEKIIAPLYSNLEKALAVGGCIFKPYSDGKTISVDMVLQGDFIPVKFDNDGNIIDIIFVDQYYEGDTLFTKLERQNLDRENNKVIVSNIAFKGEKDKLGKRITLAETSKWKDLEETAEIDNVDHALYGIFKCPMSNNIDFNSPLGVSVFNSATEVMQRADEQFSRLDWEYEGGQLAIDVDSDAFKGDLDQTKCRLYRQCDIGNDGDTYHAFAPALRSNDYRNGLNFYLTQIENLCGLARGTLCEAQIEARTATEIKISRQNTYITVHSIQKALELALNDVIRAIYDFGRLYSLTNKTEMDYNIDFGDSVLTDMREEIEIRMMLVNAGAIGKAELRKWYTGETDDEAKAKVKEIADEDKITFNEV